MSTMSLSVKADGLKIGNGIGKCTGFKNNKCVTDTICRHKTLSFKNQSDYSCGFSDNSKMILKSENQQNQYAVNIYGFGVQSPKRKPFLKDMKIAFVDMSFEEDFPTIEYSVKSTVHQIDSENVRLSAEKLDNLTSPSTLGEETPKSNQILSENNFVAEQPVKKERIYLPARGYDEGEIALSNLRKNSAYLNMVYNRLHCKG